jgi:osmotically-inducible protein OsmY
VRAWHTRWRGLPPGPRELTVVSAVAEKLTAVRRFPTITWHTGQGRRHGSPAARRRGRRHSTARRLRSILVIAVSGRSMRAGARRNAVKEGTVATATLTDVDVRVRDAVMRQLEWDPEVDASAVGVAARGGTVTLTGFIDTYAGKLAAERAAKRVHGVRAVANDIEVRLRLERTDADIAQNAARALQLSSNVPENVQVVVHSGHLTLTGNVEWLYQKESAEQAIRHLRGVRGILNHITVAPRAVDRDVRHRIVTALHRHADVDARHITVTMSGDTATLTGTVGTWLQRDAAERAAANAPGIAHVNNQIVVQSFHDAKMDDWDDVC